MIKHPLQNSWTLWFFKNDKTKQWEENQREIITFNTVPFTFLLTFKIITPLPKFETAKGLHTISSRIMVTSSSWTYLVSYKMPKQIKHIPMIPGPSGTRSKCQSIQISPLKSQPITIMDIGFEQMREQEIKKGLLFVLTGTCSWSLMVLGSWEWALIV